MGRRCLRLEMVDETRMTSTNISKQPPGRLLVGACHVYPGPLGVVPSLAQASDSKYSFVASSSVRSSSRPERAVQPPSAFCQKYTLALALFCALLVLSTFALPPANSTKALQLYSTSVHGV